MIENPGTALMPLTDEVMSYKGLSAYLKLSQGTLRHKVMYGEIPFIKIGGAVRFSKKAIDKWLEENQQGARKKKCSNISSNTDEGKV